MSFPNRLRQLRKQKNITQTELGNRINVTKVSVSGYESGNRTPDTDTLQKIADFFEVTTDYLLSRTDDPNATADPEQDEKTAMINKIAREFPDADLMFGDMANMDAKQLQEVYEFIKFKMSQNKD